MDRAVPGDRHEPRGSDLLIAAILGRVEVAVFENLYSAYASEARRLAAGLLGESEAALDVVHSAYVEILRQLLKGERWNDPAEARAAVLRNTRWASLHALRTERRKRAAATRAAFQPGPATDDWARFEARLLCEQIVEQLPAKDRLVLQLRFLEGHTNAEGGSSLGITAKAFELRIARAIKRARHVARSRDLLPVLVPCSSTPLGRSHSWRTPPVRHAIVRSAARVAAAAGAVVVAASLVGRAADTNLSSAAHVVMPSEARAAPVIATAESETLEDTVFSDAVAIASGQTPEVFALGRGAACSCQLLVRSLDAGATWQRMPVAATMPARGGVIAGRAVPCQRSAQVPSCFGHPSGMGSGLVLRVDQDHLLYISALGGIRYSADQGATWRLSTMSD